MTPWTAAYQASLSFIISQSLLNPKSIELVMPTNHLILCRPLLLLPSTVPSIRVFSNESVLRNRWPEYWRFSFSISPSSENPGLISFRLDSSDLLINLSLSPISWRFGATAIFCWLGPWGCFHTFLSLLVFTLLCFPSWHSLHRFHCLDSFSLTTFRYLYFTNIIVYCKYCFNTSLTWHFVSILTDLWKHNLNTTKFTLRESQWYLISLQSSTTLTAIQS